MVVPVRSRGSVAIKVCSLSARTVTDRAGFAVLIIIPFKTERDLFPALAEPAVGHPGLEIMFADRAGQHGEDLHVDNTPYPIGVV